MNFPDNCLKGVPNNTFLNKDGTVGSHLFHFKLERTREDGWIEHSINWEDDKSVVQLTLLQTKTDGELQFRGGVVRLPREEADRLNNRPTVKGLLSYERQPTKGNPYHGNILLQGGTSKPTMKLIAAGLALAVSEIFPQTN